MQEGCRRAESMAGPWCAPHHRGCLLQAHPACNARPPTAQVKGSTDTVQLLKLLRPKVYIPLLK